MMKSEFGKALCSFLNQRTAAKVERELLPFGVIDGASLIGISSYCIDNLVLPATQKQFVRDLQTLCQFSRSSGEATALHGITKVDFDQFREHGSTSTTTPQPLALQQVVPTSKKNIKGMSHCQNMKQWDKISDLSSADEGADAVCSAKLRTSVES